MERRERDARAVNHLFLKGKDTGDSKDRVAIGIV